MTPARPNRALVIALWANAVLLAGVLVALLGRSPERIPSVLPAAYGQNQTPIAGGAGIFIMPAQTAERMYGAYLLDVDSQTLCVYQFYAGEKQLRLVAARDIRHDRRFKQFNSPNPTPNEVKALVEREQAGLNAAPR